jgi:Fe-S-cluster containining protein
MATKPSKARKITRGSPFGYCCHACGRCCRHFRIQVNPYEVLRLARQLGISTTAFVRDFLSGGPFLARDEGGACVFLSGQSCRVHAARPLVCRIYPLVRHLSAVGQETFSLIPPVIDSEGEVGALGCVDDYLREQGAFAYLAAADRYLELHTSMVGALERGILATAAPQAEGAYGPSGLTNLLDPDSMVEQYCTATDTKPPSDVESFAAMHIKAIEAWIDASGKGGLL